MRVRAESGSIEKNSDPASARAISVSPATAAAWVRASRVNGETTKASAPGPPGRGTAARGAVSQGLPGVLRHLGEGTADGQRGMSYL